MRSLLSIELSPAPATRASIPRLGFGCGRLWVLRVSLYLRIYCFGLTLMKLSLSLSIRPAYNESVLLVNEILAECDTPGRSARVGASRARPAVSLTSAAACTKAGCRQRRREHCRGGRFGALPPPASGGGPAGSGTHRARATDALPRALRGEPQGVSGEGGRGGPRRRSSGRVALL